MNTRGGSLYLTSQFSASSVTRIFTPGQASTIKRFTLYPPEAEAILLGELSARFLRFTTGKNVRWNGGAVQQFLRSTTGHCKSTHRATP